MDYDLDWLRAGGQRCVLVVIEGHTLLVTGEYNLLRKSDLETQKYPGETCKEENINGVRFIV